MKRTLATIALTLLTTATYANDGWSLQLHGLSWHAEPRVGKYLDRGWNERNWGFGVRRTFSPDWSVQGGFYRNSIDAITVYAVANYTPLHLGALRVGGFAGLATGYRTPVVAGGLIELGPVSVRVIPPVRRVTPLTVGVEVGIKF